MYFVCFQSPAVFFHLISFSHAEFLPPPSLCRLTRLFSWVFIKMCFREKKGKQRKRKRKKREGGRKRDKQTRDVEWVYSGTVGIVKEMEDEAERRERKKPGSSCNSQTLSDCEKKWRNTGPRYSKLFVYVYVSVALHRIFLFLDTSTLITRAFTTDSLIPT